MVHFSELSRELAETKEKLKKQTDVVSHVFFTMICVTLDCVFQLCYVVCVLSSLHCVVSTSLPVNICTISSHTAQETFYPSCRNL